MYKMLWSHLEVALSRPAIITHLCGALINYNYQFKVCLKLNLDIILI